MSHETYCRELFARYAEGTIDREKLDELETALRNDPNLRFDFIAYLNVDSALSGLAALTEADLAALTEAEAAALDSSAIPSPSQAPKPKSIFRLRFATIAGVCAAAFLAAVVLWNGLSRKNNSDRFVDGDRLNIAKVLHRIDAIVNRESSSYKSDTLFAGSYRLERGLLHLKFSCNVSVIVEAPAKFDVIDAKTVVLNSGRLSATVPPEGVGFTVNTPDAKVIDFGTEFSVEVKTGQSEVHVFAGLVRVHPRIGLKSGKSKSVELKAAQAVRFDQTNASLQIKLARNRFIRNFEEPKWQYPRTVQRLEPTAYYRMPIRAKGLHCTPVQYSGEILTGSGKRPPHAPGFIGGSLRILANSIGRGAKVERPPPLDSGRLTVVAWVYANAYSKRATVVSNFLANEGCFALALDASGKLSATVRTENGELVSCTATRAVPLATWHQVVVTADGKNLRLYENGDLAAMTKCSPMAEGDISPICIGRSPEGNSFWNGRIDELALFDRALSATEIRDLYQSAQQKEP